MTANNRSNKALLHFLVLPLLFLTVTLLGGLRINAEDHAFIFVAPPLVTLLLAVLLMLLFVRGHAVEPRRWRGHALVGKAAHLLAVLDHEGHVVCANL